MKNFIKKNKTRFSLKVIIPTVIIILAAAGAYAMVKTAPKARKRPPVTIASSVETSKLTKGNHQVWVPVMGTVTAARQITLEARVSGEVEAVSPDFVPGGFFQAGEEILRISPEDYQLILGEVQAEVTNAQYNLKVEQGYQNVAGREWDLLKDSTNGSESEAELALRKPHLEKAKADMKAAEAKLRQAQLDVERTRITAPFAAMIEQKDTDIGATINSQDALASLVGTDEFWIQASIPVDRLDWITVPVGNKSIGSKAIISNGKGATKSEREGVVIRLLPSLEDEGRMARVLISIRDPLNLAGAPNVKPLLLGSYVSVRIDGGQLDDVYELPRSAYRDNGNIWVLTKSGTLDIRPVNPVWRDNDTIVLTDGIEPGEAIVTSNLSAPLQGMKLRSVSKPQLIDTTENKSNEEKPGDGALNNG